jgi:hypothetical protein
LQECGAASRWHGGGDIVVDGGHVPAGSGEAPQRLSDAAVINNWLAKSDEGAFGGIVTEVGVSPTGDLDRLDAALLSFATTNSSPGVRLRLIKFYAVFKIAEMQRYREFRGFPQ